MMNHGTEFGMHGGSWMWLFWGLLTIMVVLLIIWLVKQIR